MTPEPDDNAGFNPRRARRMALLAVVLVFGGVTALVLAAIEIFGFTTVRSAWDQAQPFVIAVKWGGMAILIWRWNDIIRTAANRWDIDAAWRTWAMELRWRFAIGLVLLEIIFGQNLLAYVL